MVDAYPRSIARTWNPARVKIRPRMSLTVTTPSRSWTPPTRSFKWLTITLAIPFFPPADEGTGLQSKPQRPAPIVEISNLIMYHTTRPLRRDTGERGLLHDAVQADRHQPGRQCLKEIEPQEGDDPEAHCHHQGWDRSGDGQPDDAADIDGGDAGEHASIQRGEHGVGTLPPPGPVRRQTHQPGRDGEGPQVSGCRPNQDRRASGKSREHRQSHESQQEI